VNGYAEMVPSRGSSAYSAFICGRSSLVRPSAATCGSIGLVPMRAWS